MNAPSEPKRMMFSLSVLLVLACTIGFTGLLGGCPADKPGCKTAGDCAGNDMVCENGQCTQRKNNNDGGNNKPDTPATKDDNTQKPDTPVTRDTPTPRDTPATKKAIGYTCTTDTDCVDGAKCQDPGGLGVKICTLKCTNQTACGNDMCDLHGLKEGLCFPKCKTDADCAKYPDMKLCTAVGHCWKKGQIGALCNADDECESGVCKDPGGFGPKVCTKTCKSNADCGRDICDQHPGVSVSHCLPGCPDGDCSRLAHMTLCTNLKHCWRKGNIGALCNQDRECLDGLKCADPGNLGTKICHKTCTADTDCNIDGVQSKCADPGTGTKICLNSCAGDNDCTQSYMSTCKNSVCYK